MVRVSTVFLQPSGQVQEDLKNITEIRKDVEFFYAEDYHQQYLHKNPNGYCGLRGTGVECRI